MRIFVALSIVCFGLVGCNTTDKATYTGDTVLKGRALTAFEEYRATKNMPDFKAFYYNEKTSSWGRSWGFTTVKEAKWKARDTCEKRSPGCKIYALGDTIVYKKSFTQIATIQDTYEAKYEGKNTRVNSSLPTLSGEEINRTISGKTLKGKTFSGQEFVIKFDDSGKLNLRLLNLKTSTQTEDNGKWWIKGNKVCRRLQYFFNGRSECYSVQQQAETLNLVNNEGKITSRFTVPGLTRKTQMHGEKLNKQEIEKAIARKKILGTSNTGEKWEFRYWRDLKAFKLDTNGTVLKSDKGSWWITPDKLCQTLQKHNGGKAECFTVIRNADIYSLVDQFEENRFSFKVTGSGFPGKANKGSTSNSTLASWREKNGKNVGKMVGYSELCSDFQGKNGDPETRKNIKKFFKESVPFESGYRELQRHKVADQVTGLYECDKINDSLKKIGAVIEAAS